MSKTPGPITQCRECGSTALTWYSNNLNRSQVQQGRLRTGDVECVHFLGCDDCSETLAMVGADQLGALLNGQALQVRRDGRERVVELSDQVLDVVWQVATTAAHNRVAALYSELVSSGNAFREAQALRQALARITQCLPADTAILQHLRQVLAAAPAPQPLVSVGEVQA